MGKNYLTESADAYIQAVIGNHVHVPLNLIFQGTGDTDKAAGVFQFQASPELIKRLTVGANLHSNHVLLVGDAFIRSKIVAQSRHMIGNGIAGVYTHGFNMDEWVQHGKTLKMV